MCDRSQYEFKAGTRLRDRKDDAELELARVSKLTLPVCALSPNPDPSIQAHPRFPIMSGNPDDFTFSSGLPYDDEPSAPTAKSNPRLDFALDDLPRYRAGEDSSRDDRLEPEDRPANLYRKSCRILPSHREGCHPA